MGLLSPGLSWGPDPCVQKIDLEKRSHQVICSLGTKGQRWRCQSPRLKHWFPNFAANGITQGYFLKVLDPTSRYSDLIGTGSKLDIRIFKSLWQGQSVGRRGRKFWRSDRRQWQ